MLPRLLQEAPELIVIRVLSGYHHTLNGVILFGTEDVSDAAGDLNSTYHEVYVAHVRVAGDDPFWKKLQRAHLQHRDEYIEHKSRLIEKMREDVAPTVPLRDD
jgi:hypothetical protein